MRSGWRKFNFKICIPGQYYYELIKEDGIGEACGAHVRKMNAYEISFRISKGEKTALET